jgi:hypothetical protein
VLRGISLTPLRIGGSWRDACSGGYRTVKRGISRPHGSPLQISAQRAETLAREEMN